MRTPRPPRPPNSPWERPERKLLYGTLAATRPLPEFPPPPPLPSWLKERRRPKTNPIEEFW